MKARIFKKYINEIEREKRMSGRHARWIVSKVESRASLEGDLLNDKRKRIICPAETVEGEKIKWKFENRKKYRLGLTDDPEFPGLFSQIDATCESFLPFVLWKYRFIKEARERSISEVFNDEEFFW